MLVKFLARGTGSAGAAAGYLLGARDAAGQPREGVEVLRGDPHQVAAMADALAFDHKYTSGVIAWAPDDAPTDAQIGAVLDSSSGRPGRGWSPTATRGRPCCTASAAAALTCMSSPHDATWRPVGASTSPRPAGRRPSARSTTPSMPNTAGAGRTTRRGRGRSNPDTAPTSRRRGCAPASPSRPPPAT